MSGEVRLGLLGLGRVGTAVAQAASACGGLIAPRRTGVRVVSALVRDPRKPRPCAVDFITSDPEAFFARPHDVIVEVLDGASPARALVARALSRGLPVVTANKALVAVDGPRLQALARRRGVPFRFEASVVAGVPFLHPLMDRPLAGTITGVEAILNGTGNFILTAMADEGCPFEDALARAQALGYAEPVPDADISGRDAAAKLTILLRALRLASIDMARVTTASLAAVTRGDLDRARRRGGTIKPIARAVFDDHRLRASVAPEFVPWRHPLSRVDGVLNGVLLDSRFAGRLFYSGPGAGPEITAATLLDDVAAVLPEEETWSSRPGPFTRRSHPSPAPAR